MSNASRTLYVGVTNDLERRVWQHKNGTVPGFTSRYRVGWLVHYETFSDVRGAIAREKQWKGWTRDKKLALVQEANPRWRDLAVDWFERDGEVRPGKDAPSGGAN